MISRAARELRKRADEIGQAEVAKLLGTSQGQVSNLVNGKRIPSTYAWRKRCEDALGIPPPWWDEPTEEVAA